MIKKEKNVENYLNVTDEHECDTLKKQNLKNGNMIAIQYFSNNKWYWVEYTNESTTMNGILYCPYCGEKLL